MDLKEIAAVAIPVLGGVVWLIRLEGRLNTHERGCEERQKRLDERHQTQERLMSEMHADIKRLLHRGSHDRQ